MEYAINIDHLRDFPDILLSENQRVERLDNNQAFIFSEAQLADMLNRGLEMAIKKPSKSRVDTTWVWLRKRIHIPQEVAALFPEGNARTRVNYNMRAIALSEQAHEIIARMLGKLAQGVEVRNFAGSPADYRHDGAFQINLFSTINGWDSGKIYAPQNIFDLPYSQTAYGDRYDQLMLTPGNRPRNDTIMPRGYKRQFISDRDHRIAEVFPNALYIFIPFDFRRHIQLFATIMSKALPYLMTKEEKEAYDKQRLEVEAEERRNGMRHIIEKAVEKRKRQQRASLQELEQNAERLRGQYVAAEQAVFAHLVGADIASAADKFLAEYEKLATGKLPGVTGAKLDPDTEQLEVYTEEIEIQHPRTKVTKLIGRFKIVFDLKNAKVHAYNLDRQVRADPMSGTAHHPHIFTNMGDSNGWVCLGSIQQSLASYLAHYELVAATTLFTAFLQTCDNSDHHGYLTRLERFPDAKKQSKKEKVQTD